MLARIAGVAKALWEGIGTFGLGRTGVPIAVGITVSPRPKPCGPATAARAARSATVDVECWEAAAVVVVVVETAAPVWGRLPA